MEGEDFHCYQDPEEDHVDEHQPSDEEPEEFVPTEAEKDAAFRMHSMKDGGPMAKAAKGVKRPRSLGGFMPDLDLIVDDNVPDLAEIFDNYDTPLSQRISICRAYASYLASMQPKKPRAKKPSKK